MTPECRRYQEAVIDGSHPAEAHAAVCRDCGSFARVVGRLSPPDALTALTVRRIAPLLRLRRARRRALNVRLAVASLLTLPIVVTMNAAFVWLAYAAGARFVSAEAGAAAAIVAASSLLLGTSIAYGSLPLLASWGHQLRERTA